MDQEAPGPGPVLIVDDERPLAEGLRLNLERSGFGVRIAETGHTAVELLTQCNPCLIILDIMLPQMDGFAVCSAIRDRSSVPILMLTAKDTEDDKLRGFELGADDYLVKPFSVRELLARVRALLRRSPIADGQRIQAGDLQLDPAVRSVSKGGTPLSLSVREFDLLSHFMRHPGQLFSREQLLADVWGYEFVGDSARTVDVAVWRLRSKIEDDPKDPTYILARRGMGYVFRLPG